MREIREKAKLNPARIIFPEGEEPRVIEAVKKIIEEKIACPIVFKKEVGEKELKECEFIDINSDLVINKYANLYCELQKSKGMTPENASNILKENPVFIAALMVRDGKADGFIAGASHTTKNVAKAVIHCIEIKKDRRYVSSCFVMVTPVTKYGYNGKFIFADCGVIIAPSSEQLKEIAIESADLMKHLFKCEPLVAFLSYSTYGSSNGKSIGRIRTAIEMVKEERPDIKVDGELQSDAAIDEEVAKIKCPQSLVAGKANVLIFPDLNAGNISYKLVQRFTNSKALGPLFMSLENSCSDLSRGCTSEEIVDISAIISVRANVDTYC
jgi:phosphate acetyltransferase